MNLEIISFLESLEKKNNMKRINGFHKKMWQNKPVNWIWDLSTCTKLTETERKFIQQLRPIKYKGRGNSYSY